ncbi:MAG TPA: oligopeptide ABC transporter permease [Longimicrobiales bacterium]|nr:oligopeptide ABC transporter permease [Longimicrobiales bacterium]
MSDARDRRPDVPDPESAAPLPVPTEPIVRSDAGVAASEPLRPRAPRYALVLSALLPGSGHMAMGEPFRGLLLLLPWGALLGIMYWARARVFDWQGASLDEYVAFVTVVALLLFLWASGLWDLSVGRRRTVDAGDSQWAIAARHFRRNRPALVGLGIIFVLYLVALLAPYLAPYDPIAQQDIARTSFRPPSSEFLLGTDKFGRDILSRILYGARISLSIGFIATAISITIGTLIGAIAGYAGGKVDSALMRFTDMVLAFPRLVLLIMIVALFSPSMTVIILVLGLTQWPGTTRIVRGDVLSLREREFIQAAHALGMTGSRIVMRHLIPNVLAPVIVTATLGIGNTIVLEAGLSFLGMGVQPPTPTWGSMVADGRDNLLGAWWVATFPGLTIVLVVLAFNLVGDGLRDALDPRLRT